MGPVGSLLSSTYDLQSPETLLWVAAIAGDLLPHAFVYCSMAPLRSMLGYIQVTCIELAEDLSWDQGPGVCAADMRSSTCLGVRVPNSC